MSPASRQDGPPPMGRRRRLLRLGALVAVAVVLAAGGALLARPDAAPSPATPPDTGEPTADRGGEVGAGASAPGVAIEHFDGSPAQLEDWSGTPLVVNFWASWCPPCVAEMRDALEPLHQELGDRVTFLGVNLQDAEDDALEIVEQTGVTYDLARDPDGALFTAFGGFGMPTTALLDETGAVAAHHTGALTRAELDALVRDHLLDQ